MCEQRAIGCEDWLLKFSFYAQGKQKYRGSQCDNEGKLDHITNPLQLHSLLGVKCAPCYEMSKMDKNSDFDIDDEENEIELIDE